MLDLIPEGCVSLMDAAELSHRQLWHGHSPTDELAEPARYASLPPELAREHSRRLDHVRNLEWQALVRPFEEGRLEAFVRPPGSSENFAIPRSAWVDMFFPERVFLGPQIVPGLGEYWDSIIGRTPFVKTAQLSEWFGVRSSMIVQLMRESEPLYTALRELMLGLAQDGLWKSAELEEMAARWGVRTFAYEPTFTENIPMKLAVWSLPMTVAWIAWRTMETVRGEWEEFRKGCWDWSHFQSRRPINGGERWFEVRGEELVQRGRASVGLLGALEALHMLVDGNEPPMIMSIKSAREALWNNLAKGTLQATAVDPAGDVANVPTQEWSYLELAHTDNLDDYVINRRRSLQPAYSEIRLTSSDVLRLWPGRRFGRKTQASSSEIIFDHDEEYWTLFDAALWVGCEGEQLHTDQIANEVRDEIGALQLFKALNRQPKLQATGINHQLIREAIPAAYWELATLDPHVKGHYVDFVDDAGKGFWGTLTPAGDSHPRWDRIQIDSRALKRHFPFGKSKPSSCRAWLEGIMRDSPTERPLQKAQYLVQSQQRFKVTKADFEREWQKALENVPDAKAFWIKGGRPKNRSE